MNRKYEIMNNFFATNSKRLKSEQFSWFYWLFQFSNTYTYLIESKVIFQQEVSQ